jgi:2-keto-4-pentenoate hydratase/2-oxohepta-3-ene-1,7-dioic acid hydratase in catechol pathway
VTPQPYALGTFAHDDGPAFAGLVVDGRVTPLATDGPAPTVSGLVASWDDARDWLQAQADARASSTAGAPLEDLRPLPPLDRFGQVFQAGANYREHVLDLLTAAQRRGDSSDGLSQDARERARAELEERARAGRPFVFQGSPHAICGARDDVVLRADRSQHDWELELAAVIGRRGHRVPREQALDLVAGYTICNDITARDALHRADAAAIGLDWLAAKNAPTFLPTGPLLVPREHAGDIDGLQISLRVNGRLMQDGSTADMLFDLAAIIAHITQSTELRPGDLVLTGSPAGNGASHGVFLAPGDVIEGTITGLGQQQNRCVAET